MMTRTVWTLAWRLFLVSARPRADDFNRRIRVVEHEIATGALAGR
jgi:hypothetical protein